MIIYYVGAGLISFWAAVGQGVTSILAISSLNLIVKFVSLFSSLAFIGALYYVFLGLIRRNFRLGKVELIIMLSTLVTNLLIGLVTSIILRDFTFSLF